MAKDESQTVEASDSVVGAQCENDNNVGSDDDSSASVSSDEGTGDENNGNVDGCADDETEINREHDDNDTGFDNGVSNRITTEGSEGVEDGDVIDDDDDDDDGNEDDDGNNEYLGDRSGGNVTDNESNKTAITRNYATRSRCKLNVPDTVNLAFVCLNDESSDDDDDDESDTVSVSSGGVGAITSDAETTPKTMEAVVHSRRQREKHCLPKYCCTINVALDLESNNDSVDMYDLLIQNRAQTESSLLKRKKLVSKKDTEFACWTNSKYTKHLKRDKIFKLSAYQKCKLPDDDPIHFDNV